MDTASKYREELMPFTNYCVVTSALIYYSSSVNNEIPYVFIITVNNLSLIILLTATGLDSPSLVWQLDKSSIFTVF